MSVCQSLTHAKDVTTLSRLVLRNTCATDRAWLWVLSCVTVARSAMTHERWGQNHTQINFNTRPTTNYQTKQTHAAMQPLEIQSSICQGDVQPTTKHKKQAKSKRLRKGCHGITDFRVWPWTWNIWITDNCHQIITAEELLVTCMRYQMEELLELILHAYLFCITLSSFFTHRSKRLPFRLAILTWAILETLRLGYI